MSHAIADSSDLNGAVFERRARWSKDPDSKDAEGQQAIAGRPASDAYRREATIAFSVVSWQRMRVAVAPPNGPVPENEVVTLGAANSDLPDARSK